MANPIKSDVYVKGMIPNYLLNWAQQNAIRLVPSKGKGVYELLYDEGKLQLHWLGDDEFLPIFVTMPNPKRLSSTNLLIKALGKKNKIIADLTAGLGVDAMTMAFFGRQVYCVERSPVLALLLFDGLQRCADSISKQINLFYSDSQQWLHSNRDSLDAIYIDTMFSKKKQSAKSSKQMQILRTLVGDDTDSPELIATALTQDVQRVVVKHSDDESSLNHLMMTQYVGKTVRFDVLKPNAPK